MATAPERAAAVRERMRVVACTADGATRIEERPVPRPGRGELLLRLRACGLCGTDLFKLEHASVPAGTVLGHELVGDVVAVGEGEPGFEPGARLVVPHHVACGRCPLCRRGSHTMCPAFRENLLAPGGFSEYVLVRERAAREAAWAVPEEVSDGAAVFMEPAACVLRGVDAAGLGAGGGSVLVIGAGSMGLLHLLVLRAVWPAGRVVVCDPVDERRELALALGADAVSPAEPPVLAGVVGEASRGLGVDAVFDTVGGAGPLAQALARIRPGGTVVLFAHAADGEPAGFELNPFFKAEARLVATYSGGLDEQRRIAALLAAGRLDPTSLVTHRLPLERFAEGVELARSRRALKVLLEAGPGAGQAPSGGGP